jgi:hypothetical protein
MIYTPARKAKRGRVVFRRDKSAHAKSIRLTETFRRGRDPVPRTGQTYCIHSFMPMLRDFTIFTDTVMPPIAGPIDFCQGREMGLLVAEPARSFSMQKVDFRPGEAQAPVIARTSLA